MVLLAPFIACVLDMAARCRRRRVPIAPGVIAFAWRARRLARRRWSRCGCSRPLPGDLAARRSRSRRCRATTGLTATGILLAALVGARVLAVRDPPAARAPGRRRTGEERTGGLVAACSGWRFAGLLLCAVNPFALILVLPGRARLAVAAAAARARPALAMLAVYLAGLIGPAALVFELWAAQGLGSSTPRALLAMTASGYLVTGRVDPLGARRRRPRPRWRRSSLAATGTRAQGFAEQPGRVPL